LPIVTKFSARFVAASRSEIGTNDRQRKMSSLAAHAFASISFGRHIPQKRRTLMKQPSVYLKMRVLGAIDTVQGKTRHERIHNVAAMTFLDEEGNSRQFTWRTIQTWFYRYKNHGITGTRPARITG
jgi:hypothetical protein